MDRLAVRPGTRRSERHNYLYTIDLSSTSTIENVTFFLPVPELNSSPVLDYVPAERDGIRCLPGTGTFRLPGRTGPRCSPSGQPGWSPNTTGYPIAIRARDEVFSRQPWSLATSIPGDTPVLMPVTIAVMETTGRQSTPAPRLAMNRCFSRAVTLPRGHATCPVVMGLYSTTRSRYTRVIPRNARYRIRQTLQEQQQTFPTQLGTTTVKPTARWVFQFFAGIHVLLIDSCREVILNCNEYQYQLLNLLGERYIRLYANSG